MFFFAITINFWTLFSNALMSHHLKLAFIAVEHMMRDVTIWLVFVDIYILNGASFFFIVVYAQYVSWI